MLSDKILTGIRNAIETNLRVLFDALYSIGSRIWNPVLADLAIEAMRAGFTSSRDGEMLDLYDKVHEELHEVRQATSSEEELLERTDLEYRCLLVSFRTIFRETKMLCSDELNMFNEIVLRFISSCPDLWLEKNIKRQWLIDSGLSATSVKIIEREIQLPTVEEIESDVIEAMATGESRIGFKLSSILKEWTDIKNRRKEEHSREIVARESGDPLSKPHLARRKVTARAANIIKANLALVMVFLTMACTSPDVKEQTQEINCLNIVEYDNINVVRVSNSWATYLFSYSDIKEYDQLFKVWSPSRMDGRNDSCAIFEAIINVIAYREGKMWLHDSLNTPYLQTLKRGRQSEKLAFVFSDLSRYIDSINGGSNGK